MLGNVGIRLTKIKTIDVLVTHPCRSMPERLILSFSQATSSKIISELEELRPVRALLRASLN
ncbi:unnamed protein product, partial [Trichogramma brassicae]